jgi:methionyl-tRNA formyltransferase
MRIVIVATGDVALPTWDWLESSEHTLLALVTQPDKPAGRHLTLTPPAIKLRALAAHVPVMQPESLRAKNTIDAVAALQPDVIIVMAYGQILTTRFLAIPRLACINLHASLLPRFRGAACIQAAIDHGDEESGISVMHMVRALDAGDVILQKKISLRSNETGASLHDRLAELAPLALAESLTQLSSGQAQRYPQDPQRVSYIGKLLRDDGLLNWTMPAELLERRIRAYHSWPGTFTQMASGGRLKIFPFTQVASSSDLAPGQTQISAAGLLVGCGVGALLLDEVQAEGGKRMPAIAFARGQRNDLTFLLADN